MNIEEISKVQELAAAISELLAFNHTQDVTDDAYEECENRIENALKALEDWT